MTVRRPSFLGLFFPTRVLLLGVGTAVCVMAVGAAAQDSQRGAVEQFIGTIVRQTATACPLTSPADQLALAGIHVRSACEDGLGLGRKVGQRAVTLYLQPARK